MSTKNLRSGRLLAGLMLALSSTAVIGACTPAETTTDAGTTADAGHDHDHDAGMDMDAGHDHDAGRDMDAGMDMDAGTPVAPTTYHFDSRFSAGSSSVSYNGQASRHLLLAELAATANGFETPADGTTAQAAEDALLFFYDFSNQGGNAAEPLPTLVAGSQAPATFGDLSVANLKGKMAGIDNAWDEGVLGWGDTALAPDALATSIMTDIGTTVAARASGTAFAAPNGDMITSGLVDDSGRDLGELLVTFVTGAVAYSQACDDYLDDDTDGKGLRSNNDEAVVKNGSTKSYSGLEHVWDEGFGYYGGARDISAFTVAEIAAGTGYVGGTKDVDMDGATHLAQEINIGPAAMMARMDVAAGRSGDAALVKQAHAAFLEGRHMIVTWGATPNDTQRAELAALRDVALNAWEQAMLEDLSATLTSLDAAITAGETRQVATHWSHAKGLIWSIAFNPRRAVDAATLTTWHGHLGEAPVLPGADGVDAYKTALGTLKTAVDAL